MHCNLSYPITKENLNRTSNQPPKHTTQQNLARIHKTHVILVCGV